ncbi:MAG: hypothetical protein ACRDQZ_08120 [Mycobacteriales bacterium]
MFGFLRNLIVLGYVVVGLVLAHSHHYLRHLHHAEAIISAVLAVVLWPLLIAGLNLHVHHLLG